MSVGFVLEIRLSAVDEDDLMREAAAGCFFYSFLRKVNVSSEMFQGILLTDVLPRYELNAEATLSTTRSSTTHIRRLCDAY